MGKLFFFQKRARTKLSEHRARESSTQHKGKEKMHFTERGSKTKNDRKSTTQQINDKTGRKKRANYESQHKNTDTYAHTHRKATKSQFLLIKDRTHTGKAT